MQSADFFRGDNPEGMEARNEVSIYEKSSITRISMYASFIID